MHNDQLRKQKAKARARAREVIAGIPPERCRQLSQRICDRVLALPSWKRASAALLFLSMPGEVDTSRLVNAAQSASGRVFLPRVAGPDMVFHLWTNEPLVPHAYGMLEPSAELPEFSAVLSEFAADLAESPAGPEALVICPGLAFDRTGRRLGRGKGYYDRFLSGLERSRLAVVGICFEQQMVDEVPAGENDARMDLVVTEASVYRAKDM